MGLSTPTIGNGCGKLRRCAPDVKKLPHLGNWVYNRITIGIMLICMRKSCLLLSNSIWKNGSHWDFYSKPSHEMNLGGVFFGRGNLKEFGFRESSPFSAPAPVVSGFLSRSGPVCWPPTVASQATNALYITPLLRIFPVGNTIHKVFHCRIVEEARKGLPAINHVLGKTSTQKTDFLSNLSPKANSIF